MATFTWVGDDSDNYNTVQNWDPNGPAQEADTALFTDLALEFNLTFSGSIHVGTWNFTGSNNDYTFSTSWNLFFKGDGIQIADDVAVSITVEDLEDDGAWLRFESASTGGASIENFGLFYLLGASTAVDSVITNHFTNFGRSIEFQDTSTAANATINNNDGTLLFRDNATAANATIDNQASADQSGVVTFFENATAGNAIITNGPKVGIRTTFLHFQGNSTADNAQISNAGILSFSGDASAVNAEITSAASATVNFTETSGAASADITSGGTVNFLGLSSAEQAEITNNNVLRFLNSASAGNAVIANNENVSTFLDGITFFDSSTAGNAKITGNGDIDFFDQSTAGTANISVTGDVTFSGTSTAANATLTIANAILRFTGESTGGNANATVNSGAFVIFNANSTGGNARFTIAAGSEIDASFLDGPANDGKLSVGSIAGAGTVKLDDNELTVGGAGGNQTLSGVISGVGGSLVKAGAGTLTLSGANNYTGATVVKTGTLALLGAAATTQSSALTLETGATLQGNVTFGGTVDNVVVNKGTLGGTVNLGAGNDSFTGTLGGIANVNGGDGNDSLAGSAGTDVLIGGAGNDTFNGGAGNDAMRGGAGNDTYIVNSAGDVVDESAAGSNGTDTVQSSVTFSLSDTVHAKGAIEHLTLTGTGPINGTGNALVNTITGNASANILNGMAGRDILIGGDGNDTYFTDVFNEIVTETNATAAGGNDLVNFSGAAGTFILGANVERLTLTGAAVINGTGNALNNTITGNTNANVLDGGAGTDTLIGGAGNDTYVLSNGADKITDTAGIDTITSTITRSLATFTTIEKLTLLGTAVINGTGNGLANTITGNGKNNTLSGGTGNDVLVGGVGKDTLTGGAGLDDFDFSAVAEMGKTAATRDVITDFTAGDDIDLSTIDANGAAAGHTFSFLAAKGAAFTGAAGQLRWFTQGAVTIVEGTVNADKVADFQIQLAGAKTLTAADFIL